MERGRCPHHAREISQAIISHHDAHQDAANATKRHRRRTLELLQQFVTARGFATVDQIDLEVLNAFRSARTVSARTWTKELGTVRHFFRHCLDNEWILRNWAEKVPMPKNLKPADREPYEPREVRQYYRRLRPNGPWRV